MKLLRVKASNFKNCSDDFTIDFVARSKKTAEDKEYELCKIDEELYTYNTMAFIGKNASGKTTAIELLDCCYSIMGNFCLENKHYPYSNINLEIIFYCNKCIYKYTTTLASDTTLSNKATFKNERIYQKKYCKSYINTIYEDDGFEEVSDLGELPEDTSKLFFILKKKNTNAVYFNCDGEGVATYNQIFKLMKTYMISPKVLLSVLKIFDSNIQDFTQIDEL